MPFASEVIQHVQTAAFHQSVVAELSMSQVLEGRMPLRVADPLAETHSSWAPKQHWSRLPSVATGESPSHQGPGLLLELLWMPLIVKTLKTSPSTSHPALPFSKSQTAQNKILEHESRSLG